MNVDKLILKYNLKADSYYTESPYKKPRNVEEAQFVHNEVKRLNEKYKKYFPKGWYGFGGLGYPLPLFWISVLEEFTDDLVDRFPNIEILQVKIKFSFLKYYVGGNVPKEHKQEIHDEIIKLCNVLSDKHLIY